MDAFRSARIKQQQQASVTRLKIRSIMTPATPPDPPPARELRILVGGFLEECIGEIIAKVVEHSLGYARVNARIIEALPAFLQAAAHSPPDLFLLYLYFGAPEDEAVIDSATSRAAISARLSSNSPEEPGWVTQCGLPLVTHLRAEFGKPVIVLTGCGHEPGRATRVEQAGGSALRESFKVERDGNKMDDVSSDHLQSFIADIVPERLSQFFFFDGEKIKNIAEDSRIRFARFRKYSSVSNR